MKKLLLLVVLCITFTARAEERSILVLGDSLSAGYGIAVQNGWVALLQQRLQGEGYNYRVINASISGDTSRGARSRLGELLREQQPDLAIVELGGNDGLRGIQIEEMRVNLGAIVEQLLLGGSRVLLVPMQLPPNYGPVYLDRFTSVYREIAMEHGIRLSRFILADIADNPELMQEDGIHPQAAAQTAMLENLWPDIVHLLQPRLSRPGD